MKCTNEFTKILHDGGITVTQACEMLGIHYETFYNRVNNPKKHDELRALCNGLVYLNNKETTNE